MISNIGSSRKAIMRQPGTLPPLLLVILLLMCSGIPASASIASTLQQLAAKAMSFSSKPKNSPYPPRPPPRPPRPPPAVVVAAEILNQTSDPKEVSAIRAFLNDQRILRNKTLALPKGSKAWAPILKVNSTGYPLEPNPLRLANCINERYVPKNMTWQRAMSDDLAAVAIAGVWWSGKQRNVPVTLVTQSSVDRLPQLYSQCRSWKGPLSAVVYLGLQQEHADPLTEENLSLIKRAATHVTDFFADVERDESACKLDIMLAYEVFVERKAMLLYPINVLRNYARLQARTPLVALVDVDMLMSSALYEDLVSGKGFSTMLMEKARAKTAFVLPAFETYGQTYEAAALADLLASRDKQFMIDSVAKDIAGPFDSKRFAQGHNWTLFDRWYKADKEYKVMYGHRYEPWVVVDRSVAPWHDVRFRGYGQNKIVHIAHMNATGYDYVVLPHAFIIHRAHQHTSVRLRLVASKTVYDTAKAMRQPVDKQSIYGHTKMLFDNAQFWMAQGVFKPVLDPATASCRGKLSWWKT
mmetsp:Transcript_23209/g.50938  ORF Transcript_23209/g.50938 Transcript_23209/m.50938 type:complete len:525 (-) Transcript_23209:908-2482(-)